VVTSSGSFRCIQITTRHTDDRAPNQSVERIVRHCLEKRPDDRFQSARDLVFDLESLSSASSALVVEGVGPSKAGPPVVPMLLGTLPGGGLLLAGAFWKWPGAREPPSFNQVTFRRGNIAEARFAPDGQTIVYTAAVEGRHNRIFAARLGSAPRYGR